MAIQKQEPPLPNQEEETPGAQIAKLEDAAETIMAYAGYLSAKAVEEEKKDKPNQAKIKALEAQVSRLVAERYSNLLDHPDVIDKALYVYGPIMKAIYNSND